MDYKILIVDDEEKIRTLLSRIFTLEGFEVHSSENAADGLQELRKNIFHAAIIDLKLPDMNGIELTKKIKEISPVTEIIVLTAYATIRDGVEAMKNGAFDFVEKGKDEDELILKARQAAEKAALKIRVKELEKKVDSKLSFNVITGKSKEISEAIELAKKVAGTDTTVLLTGETGTGKELFARAIHNAGRRKDKQFVAINCSSIPKDLQESELFGYVKGAFTGAAYNKKGYFEEANGGTIFLDEIGDMPIETQAKLLRAIETKTFIRLGDPKECSLDVRIIAATNKNLEYEIKKGAFREDLYYRMNTFVIKLPALRERPDDIRILIKYFVELYSGKLGKTISYITDDFISVLISHPFYGNIRELKNIIERAVILSDSNELTVKQLPEDIGKDEDSRMSDKSIAEIERRHILKILEENDGNKTKTARELGIGIVTLYRKLKEYGIE